MILCNILIIYMHLWNISASTSEVLNCIYVFVYLFGEKFGHDTILVATLVQLEQELLLYVLYHRMKSSLVPSRFQSLMQFTNIFFQ